MLLCDKHPYKSRPAIKFVSCTCTRGHRRTVRFPAEASLFLCLSLFERSKTIGRLFRNSKDRLNGSDEKYNEESRTRRTWRLYLRFCSLNDKIAPEYLFTCSRTRSRKLRKETSPARRACMHHRPSLSVRILTRACGEIAQSCSFFPNCV